MLPNDTRLNTSVLNLRTASTIKAQSTIATIMATARPVGMMNCELSNELAALAQM